ncbi:MAG TPA: hypothetical protein VN182_03010 [Flavobacterium sp.]|nr:hypothetical protein [Flavobacterium sp.]
MKILVQVLGFKKVLVKQRLNTGLSLGYYFDYYTYSAYFQEVRTFKMKIPYEIPD